MPHAAIASSTQLSADAGAQIAAAGGNAVDVAIAASLVANCTEPGVSALGGGGYVTVSSPSGDPVTIDGNVEMPGRGLAPERLGQGAWEATISYGSGVTTLVGHGSVGTPGALAAYDMAWQRYGSLPWRELLQPAIDIIRPGFPMSQASHNYLKYSHEVVYGWQAQSREALHSDDGKLLDVGDTIRVNDLAESLEQIAREGAGDFYRGDLAALIARDFEANGGVMTARDLAEYEAIARTPLRFVFGPWHLSTNPAPAVGGATLCAMLTLLNHKPFGGWNASEAARMARIQRAVLRHRFEHLDLAEEPERAIRDMLAHAREGELAKASSSTVHTSVVDKDGLSCAITMSSGYGAGVISPGTGVWMNNCLGEIELNRRGLIAGPPGTRLPSNMAPTTGRHPDGRVLAIGSPGADRITSAILQTLVNHVQLGMPLAEAILQPRLHVELAPDGDRVSYERGVPVDMIDMPCREFEPMAMFFGGVGAAMRDRDGSFSAGADPRRLGGKVIV